MSFMTQVRSANGITLVPLETRLFSQRRLYIEGTICSEAANNFIRELTLLLTESSDAPITVCINSPGGEVPAGMLIYDAVQGCPAELTIICHELCASMAAVILAGGQKGRRLILPHSRVMIHEPFIFAEGMTGRADEIRRTAEKLEETRKLTSELISKATGRTSGDVDKALSAERFMNAEEAVKFGICDRIVTSIV